MPTGTTENESPICTCGHPEPAHEHYRRGSDCAVCPAGQCARFTAAVQPRVRSTPPTGVSLS